MKTVKSLEFLDLILFEKKRRYIAGESCDFRALLSQQNWYSLQEYAKNTLGVREDFMMCSFLGVECKRDCRVKTVLFVSMQTQPCSAM